MKCTRIDDPVLPPFTPYTIQIVIESKEEQLVWNTMLSFDIRIPEMVCGALPSAGILNLSALVTNMLSQLQAARKHK